jgi:uncharacterized membrane protein YgdD (TMEM256/DUF423 family)
MRAVRKPMGKFWISIAGVFGAVAVIMGAFAAHGLQGRVEDKALEWVRTGAHYQIVHALALLGWAIWVQMRVRTGGALAGDLPGWAFTIGTIIFSGTLYAMALGGPRWLGAITPIGGTLLIAAWIIFAVQATRNAP